MTDEIIKSFKEGHQEIVNGIDRIQGVLRSYVQAKLYIRQLNEILLAHWGRQNEKFFINLRDFYFKNRQASKMIEFLELDTKDAKIKFLQFFDQYSGEMGDLGSNKFPRDFQEYSRHLLSRIKIEEEYLLPLLERLYCRQGSDQ